MFIKCEESAESTEIMSCVRIETRRVEEMGLKYFETNGIGDDEDEDDDDEFEDDDDESEEHL